MSGPVEASSIFSELNEQPEYVRQIFMYAICQTMVEAGMLEFKGASNVEGIGTVLMYRNPDTDQILEITKPEMEPQEEENIKKHIRELLEKHA